MKIAQLVGPKRFAVLDSEVPTANDGECLVRLDNVSICGSDIRHGYGPVMPEEDYPLISGRPCHECAGTIVESRTDAFREGQRVIVLPTAEMGGLTEYLVSNPGRMVGLPDHGDLSEWVMCQPTGTVFYSCKKMGNIMGKSILVMGQGAIGLSFTMLTARQGAKQVIAVDLLDYRLEYSKEFGATHTINPAKEDLMERVQELTGGIGPDVTVEAAGYPDTLDLAFRMVRQFGTVIIFGIQGDDIVPVDTRTWMDKQATIIPTTGARSGDPISQIRDIVELRERGWIDPARMVTHRLGFDEQDINAAYRMYENREDNIIKVVMKLEH